MQAFTTAPSALAENRSDSATAAAPPRLVNAAHEFEAQMMKELLKPMAAGATDPLTGEESGEDEDSGSGGALGEFATEALGRALSERGGLGIANKIIGQLSARGNKNASGTVTAKAHGDTVMKDLK
jgi:Rod binding domain-containing protein